MSSPNGEEAPARSAANSLTGRRPGLTILARLFCGRRESRLGSAVIDLPRAFLLIAREVREGKFIPRSESFGLESGVIRYVTNPGLESLISPELNAKVHAAQDSIIAGTLVPVDRSKGRMASQ